MPRLRRRGGNFGRRTPNARIVHNRRLKKNDATLISSIICSPLTVTHMEGIKSELPPVNIFPLIEKNKEPNKGKTTTFTSDSEIEHLHIQNDRAQYDPTKEKIVMPIEIKEELIIDESNETPALINGTIDLPLEHEIDVSHGYKSSSRRGNPDRKLNLDKNVYIKEEKHIIDEYTRDGDSFDEQSSQNSQTDEEDTTNVFHPSHFVSIKDEGNCQVEEMMTESSTQEEDPFGEPFLPCYVPCSNDQKAYVRVSGPLFHDIKSPIKNQLAMNPEQYHPILENRGGVKIIEGRRQGVNYLYDGYLYRRTRVERRLNSTYLHCIQQNCPARGVLTNDLFRVTKPHNHDRQDDVVEQLHFKKDLREVVRKRQGSLKAIFDEVSNQYFEGAEQICYQSMRSMMHRSRALVNPPIPHTLRQFADSIQREEWAHLRQSLDGQEFFRAYIHDVENDWEAVVFVSPALGSAMDESACQVQIDAIYKVLPSGMGNQLMTVHFLYQDHMFPAVYVLMSCKTRQCYTRVLMYLTEHVIPRTVNRIDTVMTDYDLGLMDAARTVWPNAFTLGCFSHFAQKMKLVAAFSAGKRNIGNCIKQVVQVTEPSSELLYLKQCIIPIILEKLFTEAVYSKHAQLHLKPVTDENEMARLALKMTLALPLLPGPLISTGLEVIQSILTENGLDETFQLFTEYIETYWLKEVGPNTMSVYRQLHRTNNAVERFYSLLLGQIGCRPGVWSVLGKLKKVDIVKSQDFVQLSRGVRSTAQKRKKWVRQDQSLEDAWDQLDVGEDDLERVTMFMHTVSHNVVGLENIPRGSVKRRRRPGQNRGRGPGLKPGRESGQNRGRGPGRKCVRQDVPPHFVDHAVPLINDPAGPDQALPPHVASPHK